MEYNGTFLLGILLRMIWQCLWTKYRASRSKLPDALRSSSSAQVTATSSTHAGPMMGGDSLSSVSFRLFIRTTSVVRDLETQASLCSPRNSDVSIVDSV